MARLGGICPYRLRNAGGLCSRRTWKDCRFLELTL